MYLDLTNKEGGQQKMWLWPVGVGLFFFWLWVGSGRVRETPLAYLPFLGFFWLIANFFLGIAQGWITPPEWTTNSSILWLFSFLGGLVGLCLL